MPGASFRHSGGGDGVLAEPCRENDNRRAEYRESRGDNGEQRLHVAENGACRPPHGALDRRNHRHQRFRLQECYLRDRAVGDDRRHLQADHENRADHRGDDLRRQPCSLRPDGAEQGDVSATDIAAAIAPIASTTP